MKLLEKFCAALTAALILLIPYFALAAPGQWLLQTGGAPVSAPPAGASLIQHIDTNNGGAGGVWTSGGCATTPFSCTGGTFSLPSSTTTGHGVLVVAQGCRDNSCTSAGATPITGVSVDGNTCSQVAAAYRNPTTSQAGAYSDIWHCSNITGGAGVITIATGGLTTWYLNAWATEWSCPVSHCTLDGTTANNGGGSSASLTLTTNGNTSQTGDVIYSLVHGAGSTSVTSGNTQISTASGNVSDGYKISTVAGGTDTNTWTCGGSITDCDGSIVALNP